ncbi:MAG: YbgC/FadM family acyl-CoA thioesterase [Polaromonas sp.]|uniref:YbgC/FadM family acyl-CoA thioesterase n=1 Tax=Polaromonas sp. TaxID=1869339 RepID=UPI002734085F|nr:YbgC/FadM family acyl-CoA thioesterase [Polaromonas sp.]MDP3797126.1 YbgC/FadM family acyl-CoA thioesterase [Polaromonas sp.]
MSAFVRPEPVAGLRQPQPQQAFEWPLRVYWEDTDAGGIVFYANYLKFFERSRTEWLRSLGIEQQRLKDSTGGMFVVSDTQIRYHRPARLDDELIVTACMVETGRASLIIRQQALLKTERNDLPIRNSGDPQFSDGPPPGKLAPSFGERGSALRTAKSVGATLLCEGTIRIGWVEAASLKPARIPESIISCFLS